MKKKKQQILQIDPNFSFEELVSHVANVRAEDVDEAMEGKQMALMKMCRLTKKTVNHRNIVNVLRKVKAVKLMTANFLSRLG